MINTIRAYILLKKSDVISGENENNFWHTEIEKSVFLFIIAGWFLGSMIYVYMGGYY